MSNQAFPAGRPTRRRLLFGAGLTAALAAARAPLVSAMQAISEGDQEDSDWSRHFDLGPGVSYLNHASIGTVPRVVREVQAQLMAVCESNPWLHVWGDAWEEADLRTRRKAAALFSCATDDLALTHSTTEAFNLFAHGLPLEPGAEVLFSQLNHIGASKAWEQQAPLRGFSVRRFELPEAELAGWSDDDLVEAHIRAIGEHTQVLVIPQVDNVFGLRFPVARLAARARERGVRWVLVDAAQSVGLFEVDVPSLGVDGFATSTHKWIQSPKETGMLWVAPGLRDALEPMIVTWGQKAWAGTARVFEDYGTRDKARILALEAALDFHAAVGPALKGRRTQALREHLLERIDSSPKLESASRTAFDRSISIVAVRARQGSIAKLGADLFEEHGIVVRSFGGERDHLRVSPNFANTTAELDLLVEHLEVMLA